MSNIVFLPAASKLGQGNIFTSVCLSTEGEGCLPECMLGYPPLREQTPTPQDQTHHTPLDQAHHPPSEADPPREADCSIRLTSGRYASYWNAFLFVLAFYW